MKTRSDTLFEFTPEVQEIKMKWNPEEIIRIKRIVWMTRDNWSKRDYHGTLTFEKFCKDEETKSTRKRTGFLPFGAYFGPKTIQPIIDDAKFIFPDSEMKPVIDTGIECLDCELTITFGGINLKPNEYVHVFYEVLNKDILVNIGLE